MKLSIVSIILFLIGCQAFLPERSSTEHVSEQQVLGTWTMNKTTIDIVRRENKFDSSLSYSFDLFPDSKCKFNSIIVWRYKPSDSQFKYCKWKLNHDIVIYKENKKTNELTITISTTPFNDVNDFKCSGIDAIKSRQATVNFDIAKINKKISFFNGHGDPDTGEYIEYEIITKKKNSL